MLPILSNGRVASATDVKQDTQPPGPISSASAPPGSLLQEEASTLILFDFDPAAGTLKNRQQVSTVPAGFAGTNFTSEVRVSDDGRSLYAVNRLLDSIAVFSISALGE